MNEYEAALERITEYAESDGDIPPYPETQISILAMTCYRIMIDEFSKVTDVTEIDGEKLYSMIEKTMRKHMKKDSYGNYTFNIDKHKGEE